MPQEVKAIENKMSEIIVKEVHGFSFTLGKMGNKEVALCLSGVGKGNAAMVTTLLISEFNPEYIVNIGTAGGMDPKQNTLDIIVSDDVVQHDFDTSYLDGKDGIGLRFVSDKELGNKVVSLFEKTDIPANIHRGTIISGDVFVGENTRIVSLLGKFPDAKACEMEAGAVAQVASRLGIPFIVVRALSDIVHKDNSNIDFLKNLEISSERSAEMVFNLIGQ